MTSLHRTVSASLRAGLRRRPHLAARVIAAWIARGATMAMLGCSAVAPAPATQGHEALRSGASQETTKASQRGRVLGGEKVLRVVAWPDAADTNEAARTRYSTQVQETLSRSPIPVLAPADPTANVTATVGPHWYALTVHAEGYLLHTHGSGEARVHPHVRSVEPSHPMREAGGFLTRNEEIWSASWIERGASYSFEIECDRRKVAWCDDEAEVLARVEALVYIGVKAGAR